MDDLLADFLTETNEGLAELDSALVKLERNPGDEAMLSLIFRLVHTIKGTCGFLGLPRLEKVAHAAENVLGKMRDRELQVTGDVITQVLAGVDRIKEIVTGIGATEAEPVGDDTADQGRQVDEGDIGAVLPRGPLVREQELLGQVEDQQAAHAVIGEPLPHLRQEQDGETLGVGAQLPEHRRAGDERDQKPRHKYDIHYAAL